MKNKIYEICRNVLKITEEEVEEIKGVYEKQLSYMNPLKMATTREQHELGEYNKKVAEKLLELKDILESGCKN